ncbi:tryptophan synthase subunit alpha [bacterium]|nr:tryptophan synthase subunit alpha [bacterium]
MKLQSYLKNKPHPILSVFLTPGIPTFTATEEIILKLENLGVDLIEIGIPFSDPLADGPIIQASSSQAIENGMTLKKLLDFVTGLKAKVKIPLLLMGYLNPIVCFGIDDFIAAIDRAGVAGVILPDLPFDEYQQKLADKFLAKNIAFIPLIAPSTSDERIKEIDRHTQGFLYAVSTAMTTGQMTNSQQQKLSNTTHLSRLKNLELQNPTLIGFGIDSAKKAVEFAKNSQGVIVGSAFIEPLLANDLTRAFSLISEIRQALNTQDFNAGRGVL